MSGKLNLSAWQVEKSGNAVDLDSLIGLPIVDTQKVEPKNALNAILSQLLAVAYTAQVAGVDTRMQTTLGNALNDNVYPALSRGFAAAAGLSAQNTSINDKLREYFLQVNFVSVKNAQTLDQLRRIADANDPASQQQQQQARQGRQQQQQQQQVQQSSYERVLAIVNQSKNDSLISLFNATNELAVALYGLQNFEGNNSESRLAAFARAVNPLLFDNIAHLALAKSDSGSDGIHLIRVLNNANELANVTTSQSSGVDKLNGQKVAVVEDSFITPPPEEQDVAPPLPKTAKDFEELGNVRRAAQQPAAQTRRDEPPFTQGGDGRGTQTRRDEPVFTQGGGARGTQTATTQGGARGAQTTTQGGARGTQTTTQGGARGTQTTTQGGARGTQTTTQGGARGTQTTTQGGARGTQTTTQGGGRGTQTTTQGGARGTQTATTQGGARGAQATQDARGGGRTSIF